MNSNIKTLPKPSDQFLEVFVREYNKGNVIREVMVEYEEHWKNLSPDIKGFDKLKINTKDNCIVIRKCLNLQDYVTPELLKQAQQAILNNQKDASMDQDYILQYLENNYDRDIQNNKS